MYLQAVLGELVPVASGFRARRASFARHSKDEENLSCETNGMNRSRLEGRDQGLRRSKEKGEDFGDARGFGRKSGENLPLLRKR